MSSLQSQFTAEDRSRVARSVSDAESRTSAEIVPVVAGSSGRYDRPEDLVGLWGAILALVIVWQFLPVAPQVEGTGDWGGVWHREWHVLLLALAVAGGFVAGAALASRVDWLRRLCTTQAEMRVEVAARASQVFYDQRVHHTASKGGVLIYVSRYERMARVMADQQVLDKLGPNAVELLCAHLTSRLGSEGPVSALCSTIEEAGRILSPLLPREGGDVNELSDALVVLESQ